MFNQQSLDSLWMNVHDGKWAYVVGDETRLADSENDAFEASRKSNCDAYFFCQIGRPSRVETPLSSEAERPSEQWKTEFYNRPRDSSSYPK